ncbi:RHE_PE00001 family protein [Mesorhizobium sp. LHD-90]|uniref:RHE_PE00001 family protein n=1 Tax=Mesorhizobium sp. LHD-90 TaxID=3071414 RepID=UPI0027DFE944|nr:RHE_PE00001 family protein [Mesorhizobium sp. LHD-90]MDQ6436322.1 RHE_PE00001 family protein [Mesorhizobium sp. LHD-90]
MGYKIESLTLEALIGPLTRAGEALARLDERLAKSPVRDGWIERSHFADAASALWLDGELVHIEDLVLHDAHMDIRTPTHELTRAHVIMRSRRQMFSRQPDWALSPTGLKALTGRIAGEKEAAVRPVAEAEIGKEALAQEPEAVTNTAAGDGLKAALAVIDAVLGRAEKTLDRVEARPLPSPMPERDALIYDPDWDEDERLAEWQAVLVRTAQLPPLLQAALLWDAWQQIEVLQHAPWLGQLLVAAQLRKTGATSSHLTCISVGLRTIARERRRALDRSTRLTALMEGIHAAATTGLKEHDRLVIAKDQMERRLRNRRSTSKLPQLVELVLSRPLISSTMIEKELKLTTKGALNLVAELNLREITGRGRYRAWGVI